MRPASVVGPIILIAIGVVLLAHNLYPNLPLMDFLASYWPFILIVWGGPAYSWRPEASWRGAEQGPFRCQPACNFSRTHPVARQGAG